MYSAVTSYLRLSFTLEKHALIPPPQSELTIILNILVVSAISLVASRYSELLPGIKGRFGEDFQFYLDKQRTYKKLDPESNRHVKDSSSVVPPRPRRYFHYGVIFAIALRMQIFSQVSFQQQCSTPGIEVGSFPSVTPCAG